MTSDVLTKDIDDAGPRSPDERDRSRARAERAPPSREGDGDRQSAGPRRGPESNKEPDEKLQTPWRDRVRQHPFIVAGIAFALLAVAVAVVVWWLNARQYESTDDAFIDARTVSISPQVRGAIVDLSVTDNQPVEAGAVLVQIDKRDYQAALDQAQAQLDQAQANIANIDAQIDAQGARIDQANKDVAQAQAVLNYSSAEAGRVRDLRKQGTDTEQQLQQAESDLRGKQAAYEGSEAAAVVAEKQTGVLKTQRALAAGQVEQGRAALEQANTYLARGIVTAPVAGRITKIGVAKGAVVDVGQSLMMLVPRDVWVTANFKETQVYDLKPGQPVDIYIDAYPGRSFAGHIDSVQAGSGAAFSLLPPENATGNFVKVLQRVPVKIVFNQPPNELLGPGMSVVPYAKVR